MDDQTQPIEQFVPQISEVPVSPPQTNRSLILFFSVITLILVVGSVFAGIQIGKKQLQPQPVALVQTEKPIPSPAQPSVAPAASPPSTNSSTFSTATWKTYKDTQSGIEFKYPPYLTEGKNCKVEGLCFASKDLAYSLKEVGDGGGYYYPKSGASFSFRTISNTDQMKLEEFCVPGAPFNILSCTDTTVGGFPAKINFFTLEDSNHEFATKYMTLKDKDVFIFEEEYADPSTKELLKGIIETVKFDQ